MSRRVSDSAYPCMSANLPPTSGLSKIPNPKTQAPNNIHILRLENFKIKNRSDNKIKTTIAALLNVNSKTQNPRISIMVARIFRSKSLVEKTKVRKNNKAITRYPANTFGCEKVAYGRSTSCPRMLALAIPGVEAVNDLSPREYHIPPSEP